MPLAAERMCCSVLRPSVFRESGEKLRAHMRALLFQGQLPEMIFQMLVPDLFGGIDTRRLEVFCDER
jgi:hypothetical protein